MGKKFDGKILVTSFKNLVTYPRFVSLMGYPLNRKIKTEDIQNFVGKAPRYRSMEEKKFPLWLQFASAFCLSFGLTRARFFVQ